MSKFIVCCVDDDEYQFFKFSSKSGVESYIIDRNIEEEKKYCHDNDLDEDYFDEDNPFTEGAEFKVYKINDVIAEINKSDLSDDQKKELIKLIEDIDEEDNDFVVDDEFLEILDRVAEVYDI